MMCLQTNSNHFFRILNTLQPVPPSKKMNLLKRIRNIWSLSSFEPGQPTDEYKTPGTIISSLVKKPEVKGQFIAFQRRDPIKEIVNQEPE